MKLRDGRIFPVTGVIEHDSIRDLCVLKVDAKGLPVVSMGDSDDVRPGQKVLVIGAPLGLEYSISDGLYSGTRELAGLRFLQFTAPISPGNSGGPLLNTRGQAIGLASLVQEGGQNLNFAVPINDVKTRLHATRQEISMQQFGASVSSAFLLYQQGAHADLSGNTESAIAYFQQALAINPNLVEAHNDLCVLYVEAGRFDEGVGECEQAVAFKPSLALLRYNLGVAYDKKGMLKEALTEYRKAAAQDPHHAMTRYNLGTLYSNQGQFDDAITELKTAVAINPSLGDAHNNLAVAYYRTGQYALAVKHAEKAMTLGAPISPGFLEALKPYRQADMASSAPIQNAFPSEQDFQLLKNLDPETKEQARLAIDAFLRQETLLAIEYAEKALAIVRQPSPEHELLMSMVVSYTQQAGTDYSQKGFLDAAVRYYQKAILLAKDSQGPFFQEKLAETYYFLGGLYSQEGDRAKAQKCLETLRSLHTSSSERWANELKKIMAQ